MMHETLLIELEKSIAKNVDPILNSYFRKTTAEIKHDGSIVTEADVAIQERLQDWLNKLTPGIILLGEEMTSRQQLSIIQSDQTYWCLDPVDGTNNFHHGVPLFSISLALIVDREIQLGIVYDPVRKECFSAFRHSGLRINGASVKMHRQPDRLSGCLASVDFKRLNKPLKQRLIEKMPFKSQRNIGTCALEWAWLAAGRTQLLLHGGEKFWDYAAGCLLLHEAGGISCTLDGSPVFNNSLENRSIVAASQHPLHQQWLAYLTL